jgi:hypothetical protein
MASARLDSEGINIRRQRKEFGLGGVPHGRAQVQGCERPRAYFAKGAGGGSSGLSPGTRSSQIRLSSLIKSIVVAVDGSRETIEGSRWVKAASH